MIALAVCLVALIVVAMCFFAGLAVLVVLFRALMRGLRLVFKSLTGI